MTPTEQKVFDSLQNSLKTVLGYTENWYTSFAVHDCWKKDAALAREALFAANELAQAKAAQASAWDEGYAAGVNDEQISESSIGVAGFGAKVKPARENPYLR